MQDLRKNRFCLPFLLWWVWGVHSGSLWAFSHAEISAVARLAKERLYDNYLRERSDLPQGSNVTDQQALARKYRILAIELERQLSSLKIDQALSIEEVDTTTDPVPDVVVDLLAKITAAYHPAALAAVKKVFEDFGDLYIDETKDGDGRGPFRDLKVERPWSGYWYPFYDRSLYEGDTSPLRKFDVMLSKLGYPDSNIAFSEQAKYSGFHPDSWEGFCDGWSIASIMTREPTSVLHVGDVKFSIADQKALAVFSHIAYPYTTYGLKYFGNSVSDGTYQDIYPEAFHRLVTKVLGEEKRPLIIDETPGVQVWNKPIFRYRWKIEQDSQKDYAFVVTAYPWLVRERWQVSDSPTSMNDVVAPVYRYRLFVDRRIQREGLYKVIAGEWIEDSYENHPGSVKYVKIGQSPKSANEVFNKYLEVYRQHFLK